MDRPLKLIGDQEYLDRIAEANRIDQEAYSESLRQEDERIRVGAIRDEVAEKTALDSAPKGCPPELYKATGDHWRYALQLRGGPVLVFNDAAFLKGGWVHLNFEDVASPGIPALEDFNFGRGITVRVDDILWVADSDS